MSDEDKIPDDNINEEEDESQYELTPEEATSPDGKGLKPSVFNRKRVLIVICVSLSAIILLGVLINNMKPKKKSSSEENELSSSGSSSQFLSSMRDSALRESLMSQQGQSSEPSGESFSQANEELLPQASIVRNEAAEIARSTATASSAPPPPPVQQQQQPYQGGGGAASSGQQRNPNTSSLVPAIQGSLFAQGTQSAQPVQASASPYDEYLRTLTERSASLAGGTGAALRNGVSDYNAQNDQQGKQSFYDSSGGGSAVFNGQFLGDSSLWTGTVIPGVLETAINTDLPGNVLARVTQNIYDSQTGRNLLVPQGTLLIARYNSSVSYAQSRVQIVWDTLIRPDGFQINLEGANSVDRAGMSGMDARRDEHWFEYIKAAGIITLFSVANARMTEAAANNASESATSNIAEANSQFVNQVGSGFTSRAMNIQPTLTVDSGSPINIMLNKTLYIPAVVGYPASQRYILE